MICQQCGREFTPKSAAQKYCSLACRNIQRYGNRKCVVCGKIFTPRQPNQTICSHKCVVEHNRIPRQCVICGKTFETNYSHKITCSPECSAEHNRIRARDYNRVHTKHVDYPPKQCVICGKTFTPKSKVHITCSPECSAESNRRLNAARRQENYVYNYEPVPPSTHCQNCGKPTTPDIMQGRFCSDDCILEFFTPPRLMRLARLLEGIGGDGG